MLVCSPTPGHWMNLTAVLLGREEQGEVAVGTHYTRCGQKYKQRASLQFGGVPLLMPFTGSGGDPNSNAELSTLLAQAKKAGLPKEIIERSIAKGKGVSMSGLPLETVTLEAMLPPSISAIIECQTDNKNRTLGDLRLLVKNAGGTITPTSHLFEKRGRITFNTEGENEVEEEQVMESVLEAGGLDMDVEEDQRSMTVYTEPSQTASVAQNLAGLLGVKLRNYEIVWVARPESRVEVHNLSDENHPRLEDIIGKSE